MADSGRAAYPVRLRCDAERLGNARSAAASRGSGVAAVLSAGSVCTVCAALPALGSERTASGAKSALAGSPPTCSLVNIYMFTSEHPCNLIYIDLISEIALLTRLVVDGTERLGVLDRDHEYRVAESATRAGDPMAPLSHGRVVRTRSEARLAPRERQGQQARGRGSEAAKRTQARPEGTEVCVRSAPFRGGRPRPQAGGMRAGMVTPFGMNESS